MQHKSTPLSTEEVSHTIEFIAYSSISKITQESEASEPERERSVPLAKFKTLYKKDVQKREHKNAKPVSICTTMQ